MFRLALEHSVDGVNWPEDSLEELVSFANGTAANYSGRYKVIITTAKFGPFVRLVLLVQDAAASGLQSLVAEIGAAGKPF